jgi:hypothetical protein
MITAGTDNFSTSQGVSLVVNLADLLVNDSGGLGPLRVVMVVSPIYFSGTYDRGLADVHASLPGDGTIRLVPEPLFEGVAKFSYLVSGGTTSSTGDIYLSVSHSDDAPTFTSSGTFSVHENSTTKVGPVATISKASGPVAYSIANLNVFSGFTIDPETGAITYESLNSSGGFDYEAKASYSFYVVATNAAGSTVQAVTVNVIDVVGQSIRGTSSADRIDRHHGVDGKSASDDGDRINGMRGNDLIKGLRGEDTLIGGSGMDTLTGGLGSDIFVFNKKLGAGNVDRITDFNTGLFPDRIQLDHDVMTGLGTRTGILEPWEFELTANTTRVHDRSIRVIYDYARHKLYYDADGAGSTEAILIATFDGKPWIFGEMIEIV